MKTTTLTFPELAFVVATRGMLAAGLALLIARRLNDEQRRTAGVVLAGVGVITTIPAVLEILGKSQRE